MALSREVVHVLKDARWICENNATSSYCKAISSRITAILSEDKAANTDALELALLRRNMAALLKTLASELDGNRVQLKSITPTELRDIASVMKLSEQSSGA